MYLIHCTFTYTDCVQVLKYYLIWECPDVFCAGGVGLERCDLCGWLCGVWGSLANCCVVLMRSVLYGAAHEVRSLLAGRQVDAHGRITLLAASTGRCRHIHRKEGQSTSQTIRTQSDLMKPDYTLFVTKIGSHRTSID